MCVFRQAEAASENPEKEPDEEDEEGRLAIAVIVVALCSRADHYIFAL